MDINWKIFKKSPETLDIYTADAVVTYVPTGMGAKGKASIREFFLQKGFGPHQLHETVHSSVSSYNKRIEEVEWNVTFDKDNCSWLVPGLEQYVSNKSIVLPAVISAGFERNLISSIKVYWDQACVLQQLGLLQQPDWPIVSGKDQVNVLKSPTMPPLHGLSIESNETKHDEQSTYMPGRVFGPVKPEDQVSRSVLNVHPIRPKRNIFTYEPPPTRPMVAHNPSILASSIKFSQEDGPNHGSPANGRNVNGARANLLTSRSDATSNRRPAQQSRNIFAHQ
ncbi:hypothetical protein J3Q64DRAFT_1752779 [Phycomyces blakesleeanus]|uniref:Uncharacterized protein n=1 Tax=Phycomyces blakesleeanus TaxID=4837 RepID=A0ABR3AWZ0_PHYBL